MMPNYGPKMDPQKGQNFIFLLCMIYCLHYVYCFLFKILCGSQMIDVEQGLLSQLFLSTVAKTKL